MAGKKQISLLFKTIILTILVSITQTIDLKKYGSEQITIERPTDKPFSTTKQICCNGIIHAKNTSDTKCCGTKTYLNKTEMCCGETIIPINGSSKCCSNQVYDPKTKDCMVFVTDADPKNESTQLGNYVVLPITKEHTFPCGDAIINLNTTICCRNTPVALAGLKDPQCCGLKPYDPKTHSCCDTTDSWATVVIEKVDYPVDCCKGKPYNILKQYCDPYGKIFDLPKPNNALCGTELINQNEKICCGKDIVITKTKSHHTECCGNVSYSPSEQSCCMGELISPTDTKKCCGDIGLYDPTADTCCTPHTFVPGSKPTSSHYNTVGQCCFMEVFNEAKQYCCGISVRTKLPDGQSDCCQYNINGSIATPREFMYAYKAPANDEELFNSLLSRLAVVRKKGNNSDTFKLSLILFLLSLFFSISI